MDEGEDREREDQPAKHAGINFHNKRQDYDINIPRQHRPHRFRLDSSYNTLLQWSESVSDRNQGGAAEKSRTAVSTRPRQSADCVTHSLAPNRKHLHNLQQ